MNREILFRGKLKNYEWEYGYYAYGTNIHTGEEICVIAIGKAFFIVDRNTVGQYTGLCDKNGNKIFEGDIVRDWDGRIYEIKYFDFEWIAEQTKSFWINIKHLKPCEVIGNIHDNPELLEV